MQENAIYSVISPEGCAAILWRDAGEAKKAAAAFKPDAAHCLELGVIDAIVPEPAGGRTDRPRRGRALLGDALARGARRARRRPADELRRAAARAKFRAMGVLRLTIATLRRVSAPPQAYPQSSTGFSPARATRRIPCAEAFSASTVNCMTRTRCEPRD